MLGFPELSGLPKGNSSSSLCTLNDRKPEDPIQKNSGSEAEQTLAIQGTEGPIYKDLVFLTLKSEPVVQLDLKTRAS